MILRSLLARNFMRYQELRIDGLPAEGAVAIIGENESGKTTIGEAIAFGLFGETVKTRATDLSQVVSWDAEEALVEVEVEARGEVYRISRRADKRGGHDAELRRAGAGAGSAGDDPPLAEGPDAVREALAGILGLTFDEFRATFYLAQAEVGLLCRSDGDSDGRGGGPAGAGIVEEVLGVARLERARTTARAEAETARRREQDAARDLAVARAIADAHRVEPGYGEELEREAGEAEAARAAAEGRIPEIESRVARLRAAEAARVEAGQALERLARAIVRTRAERVAAAARADLGAIGRGLDAEQNRLRRDLQHSEKTLAEVRARADRLIDYQAKMAELQARLDLYKLEVKRGLDAPEIEAEDIEELEGLAMPATPAGALALSRVRFDRLVRARKKAFGQAAIMVLVAFLAGIVGAPALWHVQPGGAPPGQGQPPEPASLATQLLQRGIGLVAEAGSPRERSIWIALAVAGSGLALVFLILAIQRARRGMKRGDQVKLARDAAERLEREVKDLEAERGRLEALDPKKPLRFADAVRELRNKTIEEQFSRIRELHNDFVTSPEQGERLIARERAEETRHREDAQAIQARLARVQRLARLIPSGVDSGGKGEEAVPEKLEAVEARLKALLDRLEEAERDRRGASGPGGEAAEDCMALDRSLQAALERVWDALGPGAGVGKGEWVAQTRLVRLAGAPDDLPGADLRAALEREARLLDSAAPKAGDLRASRESADDELRGAVTDEARAEARLSGLSERLAEIRGRKARFAEADGLATGLAREVAEARRALEVRELAAELLGETAADLRRRAGPLLARFASAILPRLTGGRYRRVKVSSDLDLRVYSPEKNDFVPLVDLSIGAADQLLLALRLSVGRALVSARGLGGCRHFLFLDEPLASFDEARAKAFVEILGEHRDLFPQVFVVAHLHLTGIEDAFERVVTPRLAERVLVAGAGAGADGEMDLDALEEAEEAEAQ